MMENVMGMSAADLKAIVGDENGSMFGGNGMWFVVILFLLLFGGGFGGFGAGRGEGGHCGGVTQGDLQRSFDNNAVTNKLNGLENGLSSSVYALNSSIKDGDYAVLTAMGQGNTALASQLASCCCKTETGILESRYAAERNACDIVNAIHADGQATRDLLNYNTTQALRDKVTALELGISQSAQTSNILNTIGRYVTNPPCPPIYGAGAVI